MDYYAADYARQSSARESGSEASTSSQHTDNRRALERYQPKRITVYEDLDKSGYKDDVVRKDFDRLIADCRAGRINLIAVTYMSRLTRRDPKESLPLFLELLRLGVTIVSVNEGVFTDDDQNSVITLISLVMRLDASYRESANKSKHIRAAKALVRELGGYSGGNGPFGFDMVKKLVINPADGAPVQIQVPVINALQAAIIRDMVRRIKANMGKPIEPGRHHPGSLSGIAIDFNKEGVPTRGKLTGKKRANTQWTADIVRRILVHPWLAGYACEVIYQTKPDGTRSTRVASYTIKRDPATTEPINFCDPILDPAEWWQIQAWIGTRGPGRGRENAADTLLSGLRTPDGRSILVCECGRPMNSNNNHADEYEQRAKTSQPAYRCTRPRGAKPAGQHIGGNSITQAKVDTYVAERIFALVSTGEDDEETAGVLTAAARRYHEANEAPEAIGERQLLLAARADAVATLRDIAENFGRTKSAIVRAELITQENLAHDKLQLAERRLATLDQSKAQPLPIQEWLSSDVSSNPLAPGTWWDRLTVEERREWFALFLENVVVTKSPGRGGDRWVTYDTASRVTITWAHESYTAADSEQGA